jgi:hypothetical protein
MNYLIDYDLFTRGDEAPANYHRWSAVSSLASIIGRRVWCHWGRFKIHPNLYVILLGPPGNGKTVSMGNAKDIIRELQTIPFSAEAQTKESLCKEMDNYAQTFTYNGKTIVHTPISIYSTEFSHFLGPNNTHMVDFLTTIYDQDIYDTKTKNKSNDLIIGPCVNILACTTPQWITTYLRSDIISGGFTRRAIFVNEDEAKTRIPFPERSEEQQLARQRLLLHARNLSNVVGEFAWSPEGRRFVSEWYTGYELPPDLSVRWYHRTKHIQAMKVAMLVALAEETPKLVLEPIHLQVALAMFDSIEDNLAKVFRGMGRNELAAVSQKVVDLVNMGGGCMEIARIKTLMYGDANTIETDQVIDYLVTSGAARAFSFTNDPSAKRFLATPEWTAKAQLRSAGQTPPGEAGAPPSTSPVPS